MIHYLLINADGKIEQRGMCDSPDSIPAINGLKGVIIDEGDTSRPDDLRGPATYKEIRRMEYPSAGEQLDMLWHAMDDGTLPRSEPFYSSIKSVKDKNPKLEA